MQNLPIGIQDFRKLREGDYLYVDKTPWIHQLVNSSGYYFLSRPRRFGKSLLISTLRELFLGSEDLFSDLWIEGKYDFTPHPVIHISFNNLGYKEIGLQESLLRSLAQIALSYDITLSEKSPGLQFEELIRRLSKNGQDVVLLIDEYDKPIIDYLDDLPQAQANREILKNFYSIIKEADRYLRFMLITGVSRFSKVSIFSDLNNLRDITISQQYNALAGYTQEELEHSFAARIDNLATSMSMSRDALLLMIKNWYNGYNWTGSERLYNPFSVLNLFEGGQFHNFWFATGTPTFLVKSLQEGWHYQLEELEVGSVLLENLDIEHPDYRSLLFQTGYLTITSQPVYNVYELGYPNQEVKDSLLQHMIGAFTWQGKGDAAPMVLKLKKALDAGDTDRFVSLINSLFAAIPEKIFRKKTEAAYHAVIYTSLSLMGFYIEAEVAAGEGYLDAVLKTTDRIYVIEFKVGHPPEDAIAQIRKKSYAEPYRHDGREVYLLGISFGKSEKGVSGWREELL